MDNERRDEIELVGFARAVSERGLQLVSASDLASLGAAALLGKALKRAGVPLTGLTAVPSLLRVDGDEALTALAEAPALLIVGARLNAPRLLADVPHFSVDATPGEPIGARALRLGEALTHVGDASWLAALELEPDRRPHPLLERALARHTRDDLARVGDLLTAAGRSPMPGMMSVIALELLIAAPDPRRFLAAEASDLLRRCQAIVMVELTRAARVRPRAGRSVLVIEYNSACRVEDLVAARWRGLRPNGVVLAANHGWIEGHVALVACSATPEALAALPFDDDGQRLLSRTQWVALQARLGVPAVRVPEAVTHPLVLDSALSEAHAPLVN